MSERYAARTQKFPYIICIVVLLLVGLSACDQATPAISDKAPIKIGFSVSLTKDFASDGQATLQGYQLWADTINKNGGLLGRPVQLVYLDDKSDPDQAAKDYTTLIKDDHVDLVFGPFSTLLTKPASDMANKLGYAMVEGSGGGPSVFDRGLHNIFDVSLPVASNLTTFALYILSLPQDERPKTAAYATSDDPFTYPQVDIARALLENGGVRTVYHIQYPEATTKIAPIAAQVIHSGADVDILGTLLPDITTYINTFKQHHYNPKALIATAGPDAGSDFIKAVGLSSTEGVFVPNGWYPQADNFQNAQMVQDYLAKYGGTPDAINADVAEAYSVGQVIQQAVTKINSLNNAALIKELHSGDTFNTVQGPVKFDEKGENTLSLAYLFQWQHGQFIAVYPSFVAAENPEFPKNPWAS